MTEMTVTIQRGVADDVDQVGAYVPVPGLGILPVNAYVLRAEQPVLIDAGATTLRDPTLAALRELVDPSALEWIYLTHTDPDHVGLLAPLLQEAPRARIATTYLGMGKLGLFQPVPPERVFLLNPGQSLDIGDRKLVAGRPPTFDAPETTWVSDAKTGVLFSSDCFGGVVDRPYERADQVPPSQLSEGMVTWTGIDAPWFHQQDRGAVQRTLQAVRRADPEVILSAHLPPAHRMTHRLVGALDLASRTTPAEQPDQAALESMFQAA